MNKITNEMYKELSGKLPDWALKQHPTNKHLTVISPMAVIERLNKVFGVGTWKTTYENIYHQEGATKSGRQNWIAAVKGSLEIPEYSVYLEQFGGSTNADLGDAYKGAATDALTKMASYLGVGESIYRGQGNQDRMPVTPDEAVENAIKLLEQSETIAKLDALKAQIDKSQNIPNRRSDKGKELRNKIEEAYMAKGLELKDKEQPFN